METLEKTTTQTWTLDKMHAKVGFSITHMLVSEVDGIFREFDAKITNAGPDLSGAHIEFTAKMDSIDTHNEMRNAHLKKDDFFHVEKYPELKFVSTEFKKLDGRKYSLKGDLTVMGVTKNISLDATGIIGEHPMNKKTIAGFKITGAIKRSDFGIAPSMPGIALSDEVGILANVELIKE